eukprot:s305_g8.t1
MTARAFLNASRQRVLRLRRVIMALWQLVLSLLVAFAGAAEESLPCSGSSLLLAIKDLAPSCIAECPGICPHLQTLVMQALMNVDPTPYVCANSATFICMDTPACDSLLNTAESYDLFHVPRSEEELENTCLGCLWKTFFFTCRPVHPLDLSFLASGNAQC